MQRGIAARGPAPVGLCWERYDDVDLWATWSPQIRGVDAPRRRLQEGLRGQVLGPMGIRAPFEVLDVDPVARQWSWRSQLAGASVTMTHLLGSDGDQSVATLIADGPAVVVLPYLPLAALALGRLTRA